MADYAKAVIRARAYENAFDRYPVFDTLPQGLSITPTYVHQGRRNIASSGTKYIIPNSVAYDNHVGTLFVVNLSSSGTVTVTLRSVEGTAVDRLYDVPSGNGMVLIPGVDCGESVEVALKSGTTTACEIFFSLMIVAP